MVVRDTGIEPVTSSVSGMINRFTDQQFRASVQVSGFCSSSFRRVPARCFAFPSPEYRLLILKDRAEELISVVAEKPERYVAELAVSSTAQAVGRDPVAVVVTVVMGLVVGLTFLFGFGNVLSLALNLGVPAYVAPLVAPAVDLTVLGLLVGTRHLAVHGAPEDVLRPAKRLLLAASVVTLALNVAEPVCAGKWGKAAFDAVGPLLLIGWAEAGPGLIRELGAVSTSLASRSENGFDSAELVTVPCGDTALEVEDAALQSRTAAAASVGVLSAELLERARREDLEHWRRHRRPISAETLRKRLRVGAKTSRALVEAVRTESTSRWAQVEP
jgi:hypothetical protein